MKSYDTRAVAQDLAALTIKSGGTDSEPPVKMLTSFNQCSIGIMRFSGRTPWSVTPMATSYFRSWKAASS